MVSQSEIGSATQKSKVTGGFVSIVSYSLPSLMIIASQTQFHVERLWGQRPFSIVSQYCLKCESASRHFQPREGPSLLGASSVITTNLRVDVRHKV